MMTLPACGSECEHCAELSCFLANFFCLRALRPFPLHSGYSTHPLT